MTFAAMARAGWMGSLLALGLWLQTAPAILSSDEIAEGFMGSAPAAVVTATEWIGLYADADGWSLAAAEVEVVLEGEPEEPEHSIRVASPAPRFLFSGVPGLTPGPVDHVRGNPGSPTAEQPRALFEHGDVGYTLELSAADPGLCDAHVRLVHGERAQTIHRPQDNPFACDEPHFDVLWAGDLDRDGALDLLVDFSSKYSHHPRTLWLSSRAASGQLVGQAARYDP